MQNHSSEDRLQTHEYDARRFVAAALDDHEHLDYELLEHFVDGTINSVERERVKSHAALCQRCASDIDDLRAFAGSFRPPTTSSRRAWRWFAAAAAVVGVTAAILLFIARSRSNDAVTAPGHPAVRVVLRDASGMITLDSRGRIYGAPAGWEPLIREVLTTRRLGQASPNVRTFVRENDVLRGGEEKPRLRVLRPARTIVAEDAPAFEWSGGLPDAVYVVEIFDSRFQLVARSPSTTRTQWVPERPLPRGGELQWQVIERVGGHQYTAPQPPDPPARFMIIDAATAKQLTAAQSTKSHLLLAAIYARSGMREAAQRELEALARLNHGSQTIAQLIRSMPR
jgi:hypothetical protein